MRKYLSISLTRLLFILINIFIFQINIVVASTSMMDLGFNTHDPISETYTYDEIASSVWKEVGRTDGLTRVLSKSEIGSECETLVMLSTVVARGSRGLWTLTKTGASKIKNHKIFGTIYKSKSDGLWWAVDRAGHGGSKFKVFKEGKKGLEWYKDADEFGDFIINKHKGSTGTFIPWGQLKTVK